MLAYKHIFCKAWALRKRYINQTNTNVYRLVNSYGDALPEVTIDVYDKNLLVQYFKSYEKHSKDRIYSELNDILTPESITERTRLKGEEIKTHLVSGKEMRYKKLLTPKGLGKNCLFPVVLQRLVFLDQRDNR